MVRVSTFCPRCGESIETEIPDAARSAGRAELSCPTCRFEFIVAPARDGGAAPPQAARTGRPETSSSAGPDAPPDGPSAVPPGPARRPPPSFKPVMAGLLLLFVALLGLWAGISIFQGDIVESSLEGGGASPFSGRIVDPSGAPLEGVRIEHVDGPGLEDTAPENRTVRSDADGRYLFGSLQPGIHSFRFTLENHTTVLLETPVYSDEYPQVFRENVPFGEITMREGDPEMTREVSQVDRLERIATYVGWGIVIGSIVVAAGGWAALRRRGLPLAIIGSVVGVVVGLTFLVGALLSIVAFVLILVARREFQPLLKERNDRA